MAVPPAHACGAARPEASRPGASLYCPLFTRPCPTDWSPLREVHRTLPAPPPPLQAIELKDKFENIGASLVKQVASATNDVAGDGAWAVDRWQLTKANARACSRAAEHAHRCN